MHFLVTSQNLLNAQKFKFQPEQLFPTYQTTNITSNCSIYIIYHIYNVFEYHTQSMSGLESRKFFFSSSFSRSFIQNLVYGLLYMIHIKLNDALFFVSSFIDSEKTKILKFQLQPCGPAVYFDPLKQTLIKW